MAQTVRRGAAGALGPSVADRSPQATPSPHVTGHATAHARASRDHGSRDHGSRAADIAAAALAANRRTDRGLDVAGLRAAYTDATGNAPPPSLTAEVFSLVRRGVLVAVGGRAGRTLYAHRDAALARSDAPYDPAVPVLAALERAVAQAGGHAVPTASVMRELRAGGECSLHSTTVRSVLMTLARARHRGDPEARAPRVLHLGRPGDPRWRPVAAALRPIPAATHVAGSPSRADVAGPPHPTRAAALRARLAEAHEALGRSPSLRELAWYLDGPGGATTAASWASSTALARQMAMHRPVAVDLRMGLTALANVATTAEPLSWGSDDVGPIATGAMEGAHARQPRRTPVVVVTTTGGTRGSFGGDRYALGGLSPSDVALHVFDAALDRLELHDEVEGIGWLRVQARRRRCPELETLAEARESVVRTELLTAIGSAEVADLCAASARALDVLEAWIAVAQASADARRLRRGTIVRHRMHLAAAGELLRDAHKATLARPRPTGAVRPPTMTRPPLRRVGAAARATPEDLAPWAESAAVLLDLPRRLAPRLYTGARRVGARRATGWASGGTARNAVRETVCEQDRDGGEGWIDRVDALGLIVAAAPVARANTLVASALRLLGRALRDAPLLERLLPSLAAPAHGALRRAFVVGLGLLGVTPPIDQAVSDAGDSADAADVAAWLLAVTLASPGSTALAIQAARALDLRGTARDCLRAATTRLRAGALITVVG